MYFAPPLYYDALMRQVPPGRLTTVGELRGLLARRAGADFTDPITAGIFVSIAAWASFQRGTDETPYWRTLKAGGELNPKYPGGVQAQRQRLEAEGHTVAARGRTSLRWFVQGMRQSCGRLNSGKGRTGAAALREKAKKTYCPAHGRALWRRGVYRP